jgi:flagellar basal body-associated protein FliL
MSDKKDDAKKAETKEAEPPKKKGGMAGALIGVVVSAVLAGGAAYGGAKAASGGHHEPEPPPKPKFHPPGPTVPLEPFIANLPDKEGKNHAVKVTIAIELAREAQEDAFKVFVPRVRDVTLSYIRGLSFEQIANKDATEKMRKELLEKWQTVGAVDAQQVLITDLITQ